jgi:hypothetical protein
MSTVLVYDEVADLAAAETEAGEVTLTWSAADPLYPLVNGGAESGDMTGWTSTLGAWVSALQGTGGQFNNPKEGTHVFYGGNNTLRSLSHQRISPLCLGLTIADVAAGKDFTLNYWLGNSDATSSESCRVSVYFYDEDGVFISSVIPSYTNPGAAPAGQIRWASEFADVHSMPVNTAFIDIEMDGRRNNGTSCNAHVDDVRSTFEDAEALPFVPGYAVYQDGVLIGTADPNATEFVVSGLADGDYEFKVVPYDGTNFLGGDSNIALITLDTSNPTADELHDILAFNDEEIYGGYLGGKLRGKVVACPGRNAPIIKPC